MSLSFEHTEPAESPVCQSIIWLGVCVACVRRINYIHIYYYFSVSFPCVCTRARVQLREILAQCHTRHARTRCCFWCAAVRCMREGVRIIRTHIIRNIYKQQRVRNLSFCDRARLSAACVLRSERTTAKHMVVVASGTKRYGIYGKILQYSQHKPQSPLFSHKCVLALVNVVLANELRGGGFSPIPSRDRRTTHQHHQNTSQRTHTESMRSYCGLIHTAVGLRPFVRLLPSSNSGLQNEDRRQHLCTMICDTRKRWSVCVCLCFFDVKIEHNMFYTFVVHTYSR